MVSNTEHLAMGPDMGGFILDLPLWQPTLIAKLSHGNPVKVHLETVDVVLVSNISIQNTVVCEQTGCTVGNAIRSIIDVDHEKDRAQNLALRYSRQNRYQRRLCTIKNYLLGSVCQEELDPVNNSTSDPIPLELV